WTFAQGWDKGFFAFLAFSMQMCLMLVTGHALAEAPLVKRGLRALAQRPATTAQAAAMVAFVTMLSALLNWGLGLIVGAVLARETGLAARRRGIRRSARSARSPPRKAGIKVARTRAAWVDSSARRSCR